MKYTVELSSLRRKRDSLERRKERLWNERLGNAGAGVSDRVAERIFRKYRAVVDDLDEINSLISLLESMQTK